MIRQLWRLSRVIEVDGERGMSAPAIYAERRGRGWRIENAKESGFEGVACVDDAARLAVLLLEAHAHFDLPWALAWAERNLRFIASMQQPDGLFANFILDWDGEPNLEGVTSKPGRKMWLARALWALATAYRVTNAREYRERYEAGLTHLRAPTPFADMNAVAVLGGLEMLRAAPERHDGVAAAIRGWCGQMSACSRDGVLLNHETETLPHLWGYVQPGALALAARALGEEEWLHPAVSSADRYLEGVVRGTFDPERTLPYGVSSVAFDLRVLHEATGRAVYAELEELALAWFDGRNSTGRPVYDPARGMVYDGMDGPLLNENSGAESNIEGGFALFNRLPWREYELRDEG